MNKTINDPVQNQNKAHAFAKLSLWSITITGIFTSAHHLYRFGLSILIPALVVIFLPYILLHWFRDTENKITFYFYGLFNVFIIGALGFIDGGLDHGLRAFRRYFWAPLHGGVSPLQTVDFRLLPPTLLAGDPFYEITGLLSFVASIFSAYYLYKFMRERKSQF